MGRSTIDLTNMHFGRLTVIERDYSDTHSAAWKCLCSCGNHTTVTSTHLRNGDTQSCGCYQRQYLSLRKKIHGKTKTKIYIAWLNMKSRCYNTKNRAYKNYGGRGITICDRWKNSFENFYDDFGEKPERMTVERIDNNKGYSPENCKWATRKEQTRNTRQNKIIKHRGKTMCLAEWAEKLDVNYRTLQSRLKKYPPQIAFNM